MSPLFPCDHEGCGPTGCRVPGLCCPQCGKSDMIVSDVVPGMAGDRIVYDCERCDREIHSESFNQSENTK
jgi:hypothetical protein